MNKLVCVSLVIGFASAAQAKIICGEIEVRDIGPKCPPRTAVCSHVTLSRKVIDDDGAITMIKSSFAKTQDEIDRTLGTGYCVKGTMVNTEGERMLDVRQNGLIDVGN